MNVAMSISAVLAFLYLAGRFVIVATRHVHGPYWLPSILATVGFLFAMAEIVWSRKGFENLDHVVTAIVVCRRPRAVGRWYRAVVKRMYNPKLSFVTAMCFLPFIAAILYAMHWNIWLQDRYLRNYDTVCQLLMVATMTASQWPFANISLFVARLPRKELSINFFAHPKDSIMSLGSLLVRIDIGGIVLTFILALAVYLSPMKPHLLVYMVFISVFLWAGVWFFLTQYSIHECMLKEKRENLKIVSERLMSALKGITSNPAADTEKDFGDLKRLHQELDDLPEWPFRSKTVFSLVTGIFVPVMVSVLDLVIRH